MMKQYDVYHWLLELITKCLLCLCTFCFVLNSHSQERTRILFLVDASLSMKNEWKGGSKWEVAKAALQQIADSIALVPNCETGMRVFGHLYPEPDKNCHDSRLEVRIDSSNTRSIKKKLEEIRPKGITPLVYSLEKSVNDFAGIPAKNVIIVITDGEDACNRDPCSVALLLQKNNITLRPYIIGMALQGKNIDEMQCMGKLYNTNSAEEFYRTLLDVVAESVAKTSLQINLNDQNGKPNETNVNMTLYDLETGLPKYNFYHTLNQRGLPDTLIVSPSLQYRLQVHTIPPLFADSIILRKNQHNVITMSAPQGLLNFTLQGNIISKSAAMARIKCLVHKPGKSATLNVQEVATAEKYLCGTYDLEILTLPRTIVKGVKIEQSKTTEVQIPTPGILTINKSFEAYGGIFIEEKDGMMKIFELHLKEKQETIALQPGKYRLVYRSKNARTIHTSVDKEFEVVSGGSLSLKL